MAHTLFSDDAQAVATKDREVTACWLLEVAVHEAISLIREGRVGYAEFRLQRAAVKADRILGGSS